MKIKRWFTSSNQSNDEYVIHYSRRGQLFQFEKIVCEEQGNFRRDEVTEN